MMNANFLEQEIIQLIATSENIEEALKLYCLSKPLIKNYKFIFSSKKGEKPGYAINLGFSATGIIKSIFLDNGIIVLDEKFITKLIKKKSYEYTVDYSISLDTNALSYIQRFIEFGHKMVTTDFHEAFNFIVHPDVNIDPMPYLEECLFKKRIDHEEIFQNIKYYEIIRTLDDEEYRSSGKVKSKLSNNNLIKKTQETLSSIYSAYTKETKTKFLINVNCIYCMLIEMVIIKMKNPSQGLRKSLATFIWFCHKKLSTHYTGMYLVCMEYFKKGSALRFFKDIQNNKKPEKLIAHLKNMSWDIWHAYRLQLNSSLGISKADYYVSSLLTYDKGLKEILDIFSLECLVLYKNNTPLPFYSRKRLNELDDIIKRNRTLESYFSSTASAERNKLCPKLTNKIPHLIDELENELKKTLWQTQVNVN